MSANTKQGLNFLVFRHRRFVGPRESKSAYTASASLPGCYVQQTTHKDWHALARCTKQPEGRSPLWVAPRTH
eukprot:2124410-Pleurochrysis_carterae.AAC.1